MFSNTTAVGRLTDNPKIHSYQNGQGELARFTMAIQMTKDKAEFYDCVAFKQTAEFIKNHLADGKGRLIGVEGYFQNNNTEREVNGATVRNYGMNLVVNRIHFLDSRNQQSQGQPSTQQQQQQRPAYGQQQQQPAYGQQPAYNQAPPAQDPFQANTGFGGFGQGIDISDDDLPF